MFQQRENFWTDFNLLYLLFVWICEPPQACWFVNSQCFQFSLSLYISGSHSGCTRGCLKDWPRMLQESPSPSHCSFVVYFWWCFTTLKKEKIYDISYINYCLCYVLTLHVIMITLETNCLICSNALFILKLTDWVTCWCELLCHCVQLGLNDC